MGVVLAKFRKEKTTSEVLEKIEDEIQQMEKYSVNTQAKQKRLVANFLAISIGMYTLGFIVFYFVFFPPTWIERLTYSIPLLLFPLIIITMRKALSWFFQRRLQKNSNKLSILREEKKKILEKVMDKETYKVAVKLLNRFGDKSNGMRSTAALTPRATSLTAPTIMNSSQVTPPASLRNASSMVTPRLQQIPSYSGSQRQITMSPYDTSLQAVRRRTPFPIINQQNKSALEKMVDYLVGDGLQNRFAMICKECFSHNGMALQEEFEYATFRCAFCNTLNPSRKARPIAPKLPSQSSPLVTEIKSDSNESSVDSSTTSDDDDESDNPVLENAVLPEDISTEVENKETTKIASTTTETCVAEAIETSSQTPEKSENKQIDL